MVYMKREALTAFCFEALKRAGASEHDAKVTAETLTETTMPVSTRPEGIGLIYASMLVTPSTTMGASRPSI